MKYEATEAFRADYARLTPRERDIFKAAVLALNEAYAQRSQWPPNWPSTLRVKRVRGHPDIWEVTWSSTGPDRRATFEVLDLDGEPGAPLASVKRSCGKPMACCRSCVSLTA